MKVSSKTIYGMQFLIRLALDGGSNWMQVKEIVEAEHISEKYLESIVSRLKNSGLLQVKRGAQGGYKLAYEPSKINLKQIIGVIEGTELSNDLKAIPAEMDTVIRQISVESIVSIDEKFNALLESVTLEEIANNASLRLNSFNFMI